MITAEEFWTWFDENKKRFYDIEENYDPNLYLQFQNKLREYHPQLSFQIGGTIGKPNRTLIISACGILDNFSKVEELVSQAPIYRKWIISSFKPADGFEITVKVNGITFDPKNLRFVPIELVEYPDMSAIRIYMPNYEEERDQLYTIGMNALLAACLGEKTAATAINYFDIKQYPESKEAFEMSENFELLEKYIEYRNNQLKYN